MIVLDAGVLIAYLGTNDVHHIDARTLIERRGVDGLRMNALTFAESLVYPVAAGRRGPVETTVARLGIDVCALTAEHAAGIAEVRASTGLRMPDAVVLHTAEAAGAALATTDQRLARVAEDRDVTAHLVGPGPATR